MGYYEAAERGPGRVLLPVQAKRRAERSPNGAEILGPLTDMLQYQLGPAYKGAATKAKAKAGSEKIGETSPTEG